MAERAVKHTYICATDSWAKEETTVSIAPHSFARGGMRKCHECSEVGCPLSTDCRCQKTGSVALGKHEKAAGEAPFRG